MGNINTIESNLTRLADALERLAAAQTRIREICEHVHLGYPVPGAATSAPAPVSEVPAVEQGTVETAIQESSVAVTPAPEAHQWTYETLKAALLERGVEIAPRTKMTTLLKFWELHKDDAVVVAAAEEEPAPAPAADVKPTVIEEPAPAPAAVEVDLFGDVVETERAPMTVADARKYFVEGGYAGTPDQRAWMRTAVSAVGRASLNECVEGEFEKVIAEYERLAKEAK